MKKNVLLMLLLLTIVLGLGASIYVLSLVSKSTKKVVGRTFNKEAPYHLKRGRFITDYYTNWIATQWGYFYDIKQNEFSQIFHSIYDESDRKVAYGALDKVVVTDIYDDKVYYKEFSKFNTPLSTVAMPIISAKFNEDGKSIIVQYLTGANCEVVTETLEL